MPTTVTIQQEALAYAIANIIWKTGNGQSAILCLPQPNAVYVMGSPQFNEDGLTEKVSAWNIVKQLLKIFWGLNKRMKTNSALYFTLQLQLCQMNRIEELHQTIRRNIHVVSYSNII